MDMAYPSNYKDIAAREESIQAAREVKENHGITWSDFLEQGANKLKKESEIDQ